MWNSHKGSKFISGTVFWFENVVDSIDYVFNVNKWDWVISTAGKQLMFYKKGGMLYPVFLLFRHFWVWSDW